VEGRQPLRRRRNVEAVVRQPLFQSRGDRARALRRRREFDEEKSVPLLFGEEPQEILLRGEEFALKDAVRERRDEP
jgi:hypothetical protein